MTTTETIETNNAVLHSGPVTKSIGSDLNTTTTNPTGAGTSSEHDSIGNTNDDNNTNNNNNTNRISTPAYTAPYSVQSGYEHTSQTSDAYTQPQSSPTTTTTPHTVIDLPSRKNNHSYSHIGISAIFCNLSVFDSLPLVSHRIFLGLHIIFFFWALFDDFTPALYFWSNLLIELIGLYYIFTHSKHVEALETLLFLIFFTIITDATIFGVYAPSSSAASRTKFAFAMAIINLIIKPVTIMFGIREHRALTSNTAANNQYK